MFMGHNDYIYYCLFLHIYVGSSDGTGGNDAAMIGAIVGVGLIIIIIMVITNIMIWIYCFRRRHHPGIYICTCLAISPA